MKKKKCTAIVLAAGSGRRMNSDVAKQYMPLGGKPLIWYALHAIEESSVIDDCILVAGQEDILSGYVENEIVKHFGLHKIKAVVPGGAERYDSVYNALRAIAKTGTAAARKEQTADAAAAEISGGDGYVFIHDGARPFLTEEIMERCLAEVERTGACVAGMPVKDTIKFADEEGYAANTPDRTRLWQIQTPQVFETVLITQAYEKLMRDKESLAAAGIRVTDDAGVVELLMKRPVKLVEGSYRNIKVTTPEDIVVAEALLEAGGEFCKQDFTMRGNN